MDSSYKTPDKHGRTNGKSHGHHQVKSTSRKKAPSSTKKMRNFIHQQRSVTTEELENYTSQLNNDMIMKALEQQVRQAKAATKATAQTTKMAISAIKTPAKSGRKVHFSESDDDSDKEAFDGSDEDGFDSSDASSDASSGEESRDFSIEEEEADMDATGLPEPTEHVETPYVPKQKPADSVEEEEANIDATGLPEPTEHVETPYVPKQKPAGSTKHKSVGSTKCKSAGATKVKARSSKVPYLRIQTPSKEPSSIAHHGIVTFGKHAGGIRGIAKTTANEDAFLPPSLLRVSGAIRKVDHFCKVETSESGTLVLVGKQIFSCGSSTSGRVPDQGIQSDKDAIAEKLGELGKTISHYTECIALAVHGIPLKDVDLENENGDPLLEDDCCSIGQALLQNIVPTELDAQTLKEIKSLRECIAAYMAEEKPFLDAQAKGQASKAAFLPIEFLDETDNMVDVSAGKSFAIALSGSGKVWFWGYLLEAVNNTKFAFDDSGDIVKGESLTPVVISDSLGEKAKAVFAGPHYFYIQGKSGKLFSGGTTNSYFSIEACLQSMYIDSHFLSCLYRLWERRTTQSGGKYNPSLHEDGGAGWDGHRNSRCRNPLPCQCQQGQS